MLLWHAIWLFSVSWGVCQHLGSPNSGLYCSFCVHIAVCVCVRMYEKTYAQSQILDLPLHKPLHLLKRKPSKGSSG